MKLKFAAIKRNEKFSPNHVTNDTLILQKTGEAINKLGYEFKIYDEAYIENSVVEEDYIFSMARSKKAIESLRRMHQNGKFIVNNPSSVLNCYRTSLATVLPQNNINYPKTIIVNTDEDHNYKLSDLTSKNKLWIKRGDVHAEHKEDISLVYYDEELNHLLKEFSLRGISKALLQEHLEGDVVKFYGVKGTGFFYWYYFDEQQKHLFDIEELKRLALRSAEVLNVLVYGGDAVISKDGSITIIDLNDWPSYAPVRDEASNYIAAAIVENALLHSESLSFKEEEARLYSKINTR